MRKAVLILLMAGLIIVCTGSFVALLAGRNDLSTISATVASVIAGSAKSLARLLDRAEIRRSLRSGRSASAWRATSWAARLAGRQRNMISQWRAHLQGDPESGVLLSPRQQRRYAFGFLVAAVRYRLHDWLGVLWRPVDWLLSTDQRTNFVIATVVGCQAIYIVGDGGIPALVTEVWEPCALLGGGLCLLARWLRRVRGIELSTRPSAEE
ncbi:hypothetical protein [Streptomyces sp. NPDC048639]|uniref:hypothetical protein n=1 Tax=Streptomyces sp. NPDC048639 TaxID=3365581 RepID=UPI0037219155